MLCSTFLLSTSKFSPLFFIFFLLGFQKSDTESVTSSEPPILTRSTSQDSEASTVVGHSQLMVPIYFCYTVLHSINCRFQDDISVSSHFKSFVSCLFPFKNCELKTRKNLMFSILLKLYKLDKSLPSVFNTVNLVLL